MKKIIWLVSIPLLLILTGCSNSKTNVSQVSKNDNVQVLRKNIHQKPIKNFYVEFKKSPNIPKTDGYTQSMSIFKKDIVKQLQTNYPQTNFIKSSEENIEGVKIQLFINDFSYVSGAGRFFGGILAGDARLNFDLKLYSLKDNTLIKEENIATTSSKWAGIFGATTSNQLEFASKQVLSIIVGTKI